MVLHYTAECQHPQSVCILSANVWIHGNCAKSYCSAQTTACSCNKRTQNCEFQWSTFITRHAKCKTIIKRLYRPKAYTIIPPKFALIISSEEKEETINEELYLPTMAIKVMDVRPRQTITSGHQTARFHYRSMPKLHDRHIWTFIFAIIHTISTAVNLLLC